MNPLTFTIPDHPAIDAFRGFIAVAGVLLLIIAPLAAWRLRGTVPRRIRGLLLVLVGCDAYITATEAEQIGHRMLVWRLPLGFLVIVGALAYIVRLTLAVGDDALVR